MSAAERRVAHAAGTIRARWEQGVEESPQMDAARALEDAGMLLDPDVAVELAACRKAREESPLGSGQLAEIAARRAEAVMVSAMACWPLAEYKLIQQTLKDEAALLAAIERLKARVSELEAERHSTNEAPSSGRSPAVPDGGWEQAGCPWRYPTGPCALGGEPR